MRQRRSIPFGWAIVSCAMALYGGSLHAGSLEGELTAAVKQGDRVAVLALADRGVDINAGEPDGTTALHWAVRQSDVETATLLLRRGANPNTVNRYGVTPLSLAARTGERAMFNLLIEAGAETKIADAALPEQQTLLMLVASTGNTEALQVLIDRGGDVNAKEQRTGTTAVIWATMGNHDGAIRLLAANGADVNVRSGLTNYPHLQNGVGLNSRLEPGVTFVGQTPLPKGGWTPLMYAAREGRIDAARALVESGADLDATDPDETSALILAIINGHFDLAAQLVQMGADIDLADVKGMTPLYAAVDMHTVPATYGRPAPSPVVVAGSVEAVRMLLANGADPNVQLTASPLRRMYTGGGGGPGATPLMRAARAGDVRIIRLLLQAGADPLLTDRGGNTPFIVAAGVTGEGGGARGVRVTGADPLAAVRTFLEMGVDVNATNSNGGTAMHAAAVSNNPSMIQLLADYGARIDIKDQAGHTPLEALLNSRERESRESTVALLRTLAGV